MSNTWVQVNLGTLERNIRSAMASLRPPTEMMFVVKSDAYGHGMPHVAACAHAAGIQWFTVAHLHEAVVLRRAVPEAKILIMGVVSPEDVATLATQRILCVVVDAEHGRALSRAAERLQRRIPVHLKIDTGMGRLGVLWESAAATYSELVRYPGLDIQGVCTHFASVEPRKPALAPEQVARFRAAVDAMEAIGHRRLFRHMSSSRAFQYYDDWDCDAVRPGILLYGYGSGERDMRVSTTPILEWRTRVIQVKQVPARFPVGYYSTYITQEPTTIATIAAGYADGYHRALGNRGIVLIRGKRRHVVGRISMNWITVDCGPGADVRVGDEVVLIGRQGEAEIWADELARSARTIAYEILTSIHSSAPRTYVNEP